MLNQEETGVLIDQLYEVIEERKVAYQKASIKIKDPYLKSLFEAHSNFCEILKKDIPSFTENNIFPHINGNSWKWKYWYEMKAALKSGSRLDILQACIHGEQQIIGLYQELLMDTNLPPSLRQSLTMHLQEIKRACDLLKIFKISL